MSFMNVVQSVSWDRVRDAIATQTPRDVERALHRPGRRGLNDFMALVSPAAADYLEPMAQLSHAITRERFGRTIQMYVPLYLSNFCANICTYCGFSLNNKIDRKVLTDDEILREADVLKQKGFEHVLLVTGEWNRLVGLPYLRNALKLLRPHFAQISIEVQPLSESDYRELIAEGLHSVYVYQETYDPDAYQAHHLKGPKKRMDYRLETPDRLGRAGIHKIGLGSLIGLTDWRTDAYFVALHVDYLQRSYWQTLYSVSFPRLRPFSGGLTPAVEMSERELVQLICAYRIWNRELELSLSTRETPRFRDHAFQLGITAMSAGSMTNPGGYARGKDDSLEQFEISDDRGAEDIAAMLRSRGYEPVWKDWDPAYDLAQEGVRR